MIDKLHDLKQKELDRLLVERNTLSSSLSDLEEEIAQIEYELNHTSVDRYGAISDFVVLSIHKDYLKNEIVKLNVKKESLQNKIEHLNSNIVEINKQIEQYNYILQQMLKAKMKELEKKERLIVEDFVQSRYIQDNR